MVTSLFSMTRIDVTGDKKVWKKVFHSGSGEQPRRRQTCRVHIVGYFGEEGKRTKFMSTRDHGGEPIIVQIDGEGVIPGWSIALLDMHAGEKAEFTMAPEYAYGREGTDKVPANSEVTFEIELLEIVPRYSPISACIAEADKRCTEAAGKFREGDYAAALALYKDALDWTSEYWQSEMDETKKRLNRNMSVVYAKLGLWDDCLLFADKVLNFDDKDPKALMKKLECLIHMKRTEEARRILTKGLNVTHNDRAFLAMQKDVEALEREEQNASDQMFKKMVTKS